MQAFDNDVNTAWMCVSGYVVTGLSIVPGWNLIKPSRQYEIACERQYCA